jgi:hypothetical protein
LYLIAGPIISGLFEAESVDFASKHFMEGCILLDFSAQGFIIE